MTYDRTKTAGYYDKHLSKATSMAKAQWGTGWSSLTEDMRTAFVCRALVGIIGGIDFESAFTAETETEKKLLSRLVDLGEVCTKAASSGG